MRVPHLLIIAISLCTFIGLAQKPPRSDAGTASKPLSATSDPWPLTDLNVLVLDKQKQPQPQTDRTAFQILEDGTPQTILSLSGSDTPVSLALLIDLSGSACPVQIEPNATCKGHDPVIDSLVDLVTSLPSGSEVMLATFSDQANLNLTFSPASAFQSGIFDNLKAHGGSAVYDALVATETYFAKNAKFKRRAIVLISDGEDDASMLNFEQLLFRISYPSSPIIYAINTASGHPGDYSGSELRFSARALRILTEFSGGIVAPAYDRKKNPIGVKAIAWAIHNQFALQYSSANTSGNGKVRKVKIRMPQDTSKAALRYFQQYVAPIP
ncbi:VWA domain-containing protein [Occallatibacter riparius]|uniref:VWA domain-containing protein n=1 Tax=Occallatibacter riparius TaxID=1002689 RepID=A0A9J7BLY5_9BACT|nr:VWA domain-containing protein [Occallatibacter riparius]UWZ82221.1 VWA domain-containing protein [Occallatibacter riparius]